MKLSVIVINYHSAGILNRCLNCINSGFPCEIIVVDNDNDLPEIDRNDIAVIEYDGNLGFSGANNKALKQARGEYILFLNADVFLQEGYIDWCIEFLDSHPECSSVQGKLLKEATPELIDSTGNVVTTSFWAFNEHHLDGDHDIPSHEIFGVCCAAGVFRRSMLGEVTENDELFDEDFFAYLEDVDLNIRLRKKGYRSWFVDKAVGLHIREASSGFWYRFRQSLLNRYLLVVKHRSTLGILFNGVIFVPAILLFVPHRKANLGKLKSCYLKRSQSGIISDNGYKLDSNFRFIRHVYKRLTGAGE